MQLMNTDMQEDYYLYPLQRHKVFLLPSFHIFLLRLTYLTKLIIAKELPEGIAPSYISFGRIISCSDILL